MLSATQHSKKQTYSQGSTILHQGDPVNHFYMVTNGEVDILVNTKIPETRVARLGPGQFFGEVELIQNLDSIASVRACSKKPAELAMISKTEFLKLLDTSSLMKGALDKVAQFRINENRLLINNH
ncbi:MAG: cyclic nucleotide-binding domain-containing protein [Anaerolineales bacterium]|nr:cyclic nucleotide-binding domain-containing protein [Chloroflexota bacterium]MBL6980456.1 cyclic nucleotide-binding domain-containing protein [Anaerolineales bacterium]